MKKFKEKIAMAKRIRESRLKFSANPKYQDAFRRIYMAFIVKCILLGKDEFIVVFPGQNVYTSKEISNKKDCYAIERAKSEKIETYIINKETFEEGDSELKKVLEEAKIDLVVLAGYLKLIGPKVVKSFPIINTHPSLIPKYSGAGMYGMKVHEAVVKNKEKETGVTIHFVNEQFDEGNIIWQTPVPVFDEDTAEEVSHRVQAIEKTQLIYILRAFSEGKIDIFNL